MPFDTQVCPIRLTSFRHLGTDLRFHVPNGTDFGPAYDFTRIFQTAVRPICAEAGTAEWTLTNVSGAASGGGNLALVTTSYNEFVFTLARERGFYTENVIMPLILLMCICWTSFFVPRSAVPARVAIGVITFLTVVNQIRATLEELPKLKASTWLLQLQSITQLLVFASIIEFGAVTYVSRLQSRIEASIGLAQNQILSSAKQSAPVHHARAQAVREAMKVAVDKAEEVMEEAVEEVVEAVEEVVEAMRAPDQLHHRSDGDSPSPKGAFSTKWSRISIRRRPPGANEKVLPRRHRRQRASLDLAHDVANAMGLSAAEHAYRQQAVAAAERHELNTKASVHRIQLATPDGPAVEITQDVLLGELRSLLGVPENFLLQTVTQGGKGGIWVPMFRITCDRLDVYSRYVFLLAC